MTCGTELRSDQLLALQLASFDSLNESVVCSQTVKKIASGLVTDEHYCDFAAALRTQTEQHHSNIEPNTLPSSVTNKANVDRRLLPRIFAYIQNVLGLKFTLDACSNDSGDNAHCTTFCSPNNSFLSFDCSGHRVWLNPPFHVAKEFIQHYLQCKAKDPHRTSCCLVVPLWESASYWPLVKNWQQVLRFEVGYQLFDVPAGNSTRRTLPGIPWPVVVLYDPPAPVAHTSICAVVSSTKGTSSPKTQQQTTKNTKDYTMHFSGTLAGAPVDCFVDSGCTTSICNQNLVQKYGYKVTPTHHQVILADGTSIQALGTVTMVLRIQKYRQKVTLLVLPLDNNFDVILGCDWLQKHKATMSWQDMCLTVHSGNRKFKLVRQLAQPDPVDLATAADTSTAGVQHSLLSAMQVKRILRKKPQTLSQAYLCFIRSMEDDNNSSMIINDGLVPQEDLKLLLDEYQHLFPEELPPGLPPHRTPHHIQLMPNEKIPARSPYRLTPLEKKELEKQVAHLLKLGYIRPSSSPFASPVLFVPKPGTNPDGSPKLRMCVDYRALNRITVKNKYPLPRIDDIFDRLSSSTVFSSIDLYSGYWQVRMSDDDAPKTAFTTHLGLFEFLVLPFGLCNAPSTFQTLMNTVLQKEIAEGFVVVYIDDILVHSTSPEQHLVHLKRVFDTLTKNQLYCQAAKCEFNMKELKFLGHIVGNGQIKPDPKKVKAVVDWPQPKDVHEVRAFVGLATYFRKFIQGYSALVAPLTDLFKGAKKKPRIKRTNVPPAPPFNFGPEAQEAFEGVKQALVTAPALRLPDWNKTFEVICDGSPFAVGAVLLQDGYPLAFESRKLNKAEKNYSQREREILSLIHAIKAWDVYLRHSKFTLITDHCPLTFLQSQKNMTDRLWRWVSMLQQYNFEIKWKPGKTNVADPISRRPDYVSMLLALRSRKDPAAAAMAQKQDTIFKDIKQGYVLDPYFRNKSNTRKYNLVNGIYYAGDKVVVPESAQLRNRILYEAHDTPYAGHLGVPKTVDKILQLGYTWPGLRTYVNKYVKSCVSCQRNKNSTQKPAGLLQFITIPEAPWLVVAVDMIAELPLTKNGYNAIVVFVDHLTKMVHFVPTVTTLDAQGYAKLFRDHVFKLHGIPEKVISDRGVQFVNNFIRALYAYVGTKAAPSTAFHPQTNGQTEVTNRILEQMLRHFVSSTQDDWDEYLACAEFAYNSSKHSSTGEIPFELNYGYLPRTPFHAFNLDKPLPVQVDKAKPTPAARRFAQKQADALKRARQCLAEAKNKYKQQADKHRKAVEFKVGDQVLLATRNIKLKTVSGPGSQKLMPRFIGPYTVAELRGNTACKLDLPPELKALHPTFHVSLLKLYDASRHVPSPKPVLVDGNIEFEVEAILEHRDVNRTKTNKNTGNKRKSIKREYLVKWKGYGNESNTWEPESNCKNCPLVVQAYWDRLASKPSRPRSTRTKKRKR